MNNSSAKLNTSPGFTLIEAMVVVVIIAILAAIAYPSYVKQIRKANRVVAKSALLDIANRQEHYFFSNRSYGIMTDLGYSDPAYFGANNALSSGADAIYAVTATAVNSGSGSCGTAPCFQLQATPQNDQANDADCGSFTLTSDNKKGPDPSGSDCW